MSTAIRGKITEKQIDRLLEKYSIEGSRDLKKLMQDCYSLGYNADTIQTKLPPAGAAAVTLPLLNPPLP